MTTCNPRLRRFACLALLGIGLATPGCGGDAEALPEGVTRCDACHDLAELGTAVADASLAPGDWAAVHADGVVRVDPMFPEPGLWWAVPWIGRGHHDANALADCAGCHPVDAGGFGHGVRTFPALDAVFAGGTDCAGTCHAWLPATATAVGFDPAEGDAPTWTGSLRPRALLEGADNAHSRLWREGARPADPDAFGYGAFNPGCGGCHQVATEDHGHVTGCLDCHRFGGPGGRLHGLHADAIADGVDAIDPGLAASGGSRCDYCHADGDSPGPRARAACYGCHLSGHQPLDADGMPHFWRVD